MRRDGGLGGGEVGQNDGFAEHTGEEGGFVEGDVRLDVCAARGCGGEGECWDEDLFESGPERC